MAGNKSRRPGSHAAEAPRFRDPPRKVAEGTNRGMPAGFMLQAGRGVPCRVPVALHVAGALSFSSGVE